MTHEIQPPFDSLPQHIQAALIMREQMDGERWGLSVCAWEAERVLRMLNDECLTIRINRGEPTA